MGLLTPTAPLTGLASDEAPCISLFSHTIIFTALAWRSGRFFWIMAAILVTARGDRQGPVTRYLVHVIYARGSAWPSLSCTKELTGVAWPSVHPSLASRMDRRAGADSERCGRRGGLAVRTRAIRRRRDGELDPGSIDPVTEFDDGSCLVGTDAREHTSAGHESKAGEELSSHPAVFRLSRREAFPGANRIRFCAMCLIIQKLAGA